MGRPGRRLLPGTGALSSLETCAGDGAGTRSPAQPVSQRRPLGARPRTRGPPGAAPLSAAPSAAAGGSTGQRAASAPLPGSFCRCRGRGGAGRGGGLGSCSPPWLAWQSCAQRGSPCRCPGARHGARRGSLCPGLRPAPRRPLRPRAKAPQGRVSGSRQRGRVVEDDPHRPSGPAGVDRVPGHQGGGPGARVPAPAM